MVDVVGVERVEQIAMMTDPVERNYQITQSYYELSEALRRVLGDPKNANWSTFAAWASCTAGRSIREEDLPKWGHRLIQGDALVQRHLGGVLSFVLKTTGFDLDLLDNVTEILTQVSAQVADGNRKVYAELGPLFARFVAAAGDANLLQVFFGGLRTGPVEAEGQDLLRLAFQNYLDAKSAGDPKQKAELMLLGNCRIGLHEQTRLQPNIKAAVDEPVAELLTDVVLRPLSARLALRVLGVFGVRRAAVYAVAEAQWEGLATRYAMNLALPEGDEIALGGDHIRWPSPTAPELEHVENSELRQLLARFDDNLQKLRREGAQNWTSLQDRMGYIVELFRSQQQYAKFFTPPPR